MTYPTFILICLVLERPTWSFCPFRWWVARRSCQWRWWPTWRSCPWRWWPTWCSCSLRWWPTWCSCPWRWWPTWCSCPWKWWPTFVSFHPGDGATWLSCLGTVSLVLVFQVGMWDPHFPPGRTACVPHCQNYIVVFGIRCKISLLKVWNRPIILITHW